MRTIQVLLTSRKNVIAHEKKRQQEELVEVVEEDDDDNLSFAPAALPMTIVVHVQD